MNATSTAGGQNTLLNLETALDLVSLDPATGLVETKKAHAYLQSQTYQAEYLSEWSETTPELVSRLDMQVPLAPEVGFWMPAMSLLFKLRFPKLGRPVNSSDIGGVDANFQFQDSEDTIGQTLVATWLQTGASAVMGKLTVDITQFYPKLNDTFLGENVKIFITNRRGDIICARQLSQQLTPMEPKAGLIPGALDCLKFLNILGFEEFKDILLPEHLETYETQEILRVDNGLIVLSPMGGADEEQYNRFWVVVSAESEPFANDVLMAFSYILISFGVFPYVVSITVIVMYALREKAIGDKQNVRESALSHTKLVLGMVEEIKQDPSQQTQQR